MNRPIIVPLIVWLAIIACLIFFLGFALPARAEAILHAQSADGVTITLHDDPCRLEAVTNLPYRATWEEGGAKHEGCWAPHPHAKAVASYWSDRTVATIPFSLLRKVHNL